MTRSVAQQGCKQRLSRQQGPQGNKDRTVLSGLQFAWTDCRLYAAQVHRQRPGDARGLNLARPAPGIHRRALCWGRRQPSTRCNSPPFCYAALTPRRYHHLSLASEAIPSKRFIPLRFTRLRPVVLILARFDSLLYHATRALNTKTHLSTAQHCHITLSTLSFSRKIIILPGSSPAPMAYYDVDAILTDAQVTRYCQLFASLRLQTW
jgi:hypothetical protein